MLNTEVIHEPHDYHCGDISGPGYRKRVSHDPDVFRYAKAVCGVIMAVQTSRNEEA
jgi:hypothetical protein